MQGKLCFRYRQRKTVQVFAQMNIPCTSIAAKQILCSLMYVHMQQLHKPLCILGCRSTANYFSFFFKGPYTLSRKKSPAPHTHFALVQKKRRDCSKLDSNSAPYLKAGWCMENQQSPGSKLYFFFVVIGSLAVETNLCQHRHDSRFTTTVHEKSTASDPGAEMAT